MDSTIAMVLGILALVATTFLVGYSCGSEYPSGPIGKVEEERLLIECEDETTRWVPMPKCEQDKKQ